jgi:cation transport protein ChaC
MTHWVFGYGSLIWRPGFAFLRQAPALLTGAHRSLCVYSHRHRGTEAQPGLVFGPGPRCARARPAGGCSPSW